MVENKQKMAEIQKVHPYHPVLSLMGTATRPATTEVVLAMEFSSPKTNANPEVPNL